MFRQKRTSRSGLTRRILLALSGIASIAFGYYLGNVYRHQPPSDLTAFLLPEPVVMQFHPGLLDHTGRPVSDQMSNQWQFLILGQSIQKHCGDLLRVYISALNRLAPQPGLQNRIGISYLALGTIGDEPDQTLESFINFYHPDALGITGPDDALQAVSRTMGISRQDVDSQLCKPRHSIVALISPDAKLHAYFSGMGDPQVIANDVFKIIQYLDPDLTNT